MSEKLNGPDAAEARSALEWRNRIDEIGQDLGHYQPLGAEHAAFFVDAGPTLLVTFERTEKIRGESPGQMPFGYRIATGLGWSHLCIIAESETWYRDPAVYRYFDRLVDDAFFEDFDQVVFYGAGSGGYAAAAYSVTAPCSTVIAVQPQATLDPRVTGWDDRFARRRRISFTDRYGFAPDMIDGAGAVFVLFDPAEQQDAMHAALFTKPFVSMLRCPNLGNDIELALLQMGVLPRLLARAGAGSLDAAAFQRFYRARRTHGGYLRRLLARLQDDDRPLLSAYVCRAVLAHIAAPRIRRRMQEVEAELAARGTPLRPRATGTTVKDARMEPAGVAVP